MADSPRIEELKRRVHSDPASIAFAALAEEYRRAQRFEEAIETCTAGLIRHPSYLSAHVTLGRALIEVGRLEDARNELEYVLRLAPENLAAIRGLAEIHDRLGEESPEPNQTAKSQVQEPTAPEITVAEIHAASGFSQPPAEEAEPAPFYAPAPEKPEPVTLPVPPPREAEPATAPVLPPWEAEPVTLPVPPTWAQPITPPVPPPFDSPGTTARSGLPPWEVEPFAPSVQPVGDAEPAPSYIPISLEETPAHDTPPVLASVSHVHQMPDEPALAPFASAQGLEEFLKAILRARAARDASR